MKSYSICIDPGHGMGSDGKYQRPLIDCRNGKAEIINDFKPSELDGVEGVYREDFGTLAITRAIQAELECAGHKVYLTRGDKMDAGIWLSNKLDLNSWQKKNWKNWRFICEYAKKVGSEVFVSIHTNAGKGTGSTGFWYASPQGPALAKALTDSLLKELNIPTRKILKRPYCVLGGHSQGKAVLLECLFHDNYNEIQLLLTDQGILKIGKAIADGIVNYISTI